jgi:hypothetical protein
VHNRPANLKTREVNSVPAIFLHACRHKAENGNAIHYIDQNRHPAMSTETTAVESFNEFYRSRWHNMTTWKER